MKKFKTFGGEIGGSEPKIVLDGDNSALLAGNSTVNIKLAYDGILKPKISAVQPTS
ncbi:MAG: hypothetical protein HFK09_03595 [Clostridia bacterium]|nr:hypothetical protein [Clostridia bacterium]